MDYTLKALKSQYLSSISYGILWFFASQKCKLASAQFIPRILGTASGVLSAGHIASLATEPAEMLAKYEKSHRLRDGF